MYVGNFQTATMYCSESYLSGELYGLRVISEVDPATVDSKLLLKIDWVTDEGGLWRCDDNDPVNWLTFQCEGYGKYHDLEMMIEANWATGTYTYTVSNDADD
jgi:hypothetical protein